MSSAAPISVLTPRALTQLFDQGALARGRAYAAERRAQVLQSGPGSLQAVVAGSGRQTYLVELHWESIRGGVQLDDACSCPLGGACKHVVASILTAQGAVGSVPPARSAWRQALGEAVGGVSHPEADATLVPLGLELSVQLATSGRPGASSGLQISLRPLRSGRNGRWVKTGVAWRDLRYHAGYGLRDVQPRHLDVLTGLLSATRNTYYSDPASISIESFGPDLWFHLARAAEAGIVLVGAGSTPGEVLLARAPHQVAVDLVADDEGTVTLSTRLVVGDAPVALDPRAVRLLGQPVHGLAHVAAGVLHLAPLREAVPVGLANLLTKPPLVLPPSDVDEFFTAYQPLLARIVPVSSSNGSVTMRETVFESLVLVVDRLAVDIAELTWVARYRRGDQAIDHPLLGTGPLRDVPAEQAARSALTLPLHLLPALAGSDGTPRDARVRGGEAVTLLTEVVPWLAEAGGGVVVEIRGDVPELRAAESDPLISLTVRDGEPDAGQATDWFDLDVEVSVDGEVVPFAGLFIALNNDEEVLVLASGTWLRLDRDEFAALRRLIDEARGLTDHDRGGPVRINPFQVGWWDELAALGVVREQSERWSERTGRLSGLAAPEPVPPPAGLEATLRPYQQEGFDWLAFLHRNGLGGILADDMGLGKTVQALALCLHALEHQPSSRFLVVAPTSVVDNWRREAGQFAPGLTVCTIGETASRRGSTLAETIGDARLVVTSYALFRLEYEAYADLDWDVLLLDEAQFVKNHQGKTYQCVRRLNVATKLAITGTPMENSLMDLWALLSITAPGLFPDPKRFADVYRRPIESGRAPDVLATLRRRIAPLMRRRTKDAVLTELPPKTEQIIEVELSPRHARIYQTQLQRQRQKVLGLVGDVQRHRFEIFKSLTLLRQLSLDPALVDPAHAAIGSAKLDRLESDLLQVVAEGHRALVFSQFTRYLSRVRTRLDAAGIGHVYLDGRTRKRAEVVEAFRRGDVPVFVISLKAGGVGLNLTEADYCFILDPWWNPAVEDQAIDRTHRIGQVNPVVVYRYVAQRTIEEKVMELKARKAALFNDVIDADGALAGALTEADVRGLLDLT